MTKKSTVQPDPVDALMQALRAKHANDDDLRYLARDVVNDLTLYGQVKVLLLAGVKEEDILSAVPAKVECPECHRWIYRDEAVWIEDHWSCNVCLAKKGKVLARSVARCVRCDTRVPSSHRDSTGMGKFCCQVVRKAQ